MPIRQNLQEVLRRFWTEVLSRWRKIIRQIRNGTLQLLYCFYADDGCRARASSSDTPPASKRRKVVIKQEPPREDSDSIASAVASASLHRRVFSNLTRFDDLESYDDVQASPSPSPSLPDYSHRRVIRHGEGENQMSLSFVWNSRVRQSFDWFDSTTRSRYLDCKSKWRHQNSEKNLPPKPHLR